MRDDLYFIRMIEAACDQPDRRRALQEAFEEIRRLGQEPRYHRGFHQFLQWIEITAHTRAQVEASRMQPAVPEQLGRPPGIELVIERDRTVIATVRLDRQASTVVGDIVPGAYCFRLDTGTVLWVGSISERDGFVEKPESGRPLRMAAATPASSAVPRNELRLAAGAVMVRLRRDGPRWWLEIESLRSER